MQDNNSSIKNSDSIFIPDKESLRIEFEAAVKTRYTTVKDTEARLESVLASLASPPTMKVRIKKFQSYYRKYLHLLRNGDANPKITDLMGIRIICPFIEDLAAAENLIKEHFNVIETEQKGHFNFKEFGYESTHLLIKIPDDIVAAQGDTGCDVIEIQIRTTLQDAWAEVEHELYYKAEFSPFDVPMKRKLAAVNASLTLADIVFQEIRDYQKKLNSQLDKRRESFYQKIEEATDAVLFSDTLQKDNFLEIPVKDKENISIDDLLLNALSFHNKNRFEEAITVYSRILELNPEKTITSIIYKHRGMAFFAQSKYHEATADFSFALALDKKSYKAAYYRGVVQSVLKHYSQAIDDYSLSLEINPYQAFCLYRRGQAYFHVGDYPQALADCEAAFSMEPDDGQIQKFRDLVKAKLKM